MGKCVCGGGGGGGRGGSTRGYLSQGPDHLEENVRLVRGDGINKNVNNNTKISI